MKKMNHFVGLDFETGGLDSVKCGITEVGMIAFRADDFKELQRYQSYVSMYHRKDLRKRIVKKAEREDPVQMEYDWDMMKRDTNITKELLEKKGKPLQEVAVELFEKIKKVNLDNGRRTKPILVGHNIVFDIGFLQQLCGYTGHDPRKYFAGKEDFYGNFQPNYMDTLSLSRLYFAPNEKVISHNLSDVAERFGIELFAAHSAQYDTEVSNGLFQRYVSLLRNGSGKSNEQIKERARDHFKF
ncbi:MAG: 3'-5' exonuclease [Bacteroidota bacterium]